jgi:TIR domain/Domain of unknown function (DUF4062)
MSTNREVPPGVNDLFISYSHLDNQPWREGQRRWVAEFHRELETRLEMLLGRRVRIWRDEKIRGNDEFDDAIVAALRNSRAFACILTPRYLKSEWCTRELGLFLNRLRGLAAGPKPFFKIVKTRIDRLDEPQEIRRFPGYEFFHETASGGISELYPTRAEGSQESRDFWQKIDDLAQEITHVVEGSPEAATNGKTVYLAETTADVKLAREQVRRELAQRGYRVVPDESLPSRAEDLVPVIESDLRECCLSVHPVGARYGFIPEGDTRSIVELQIEAATAHNGHAQHLIWVPPEAVPPSDSRQEQLLERLRRSYTERPQTELLELKPIEDLKTRLVEKLEAPRSAARPAATEQTVRVYVICDPADRDAVKPLEGYLRLHGYSVNLPLVEGTEQEICQDHQDTLVWCDAVLIYYGAARQAWLRAKQRDLWKAPGWGRSKRLLAQAVVIGPPARADKSDVANDEFLIVRSEPDLRVEALVPFLDCLRDRAGAAV